MHYLALFCVVFNIMYAPPSQQQGEKPCKTGQIRAFKEFDYMIRVLFVCHGNLTGRQNWTGKSEQIAAKRGRRNTVFTTIQLQPMLWHRVVGGKLRKIVAFKGAIIMNVINNVCLLCGYFPFLDGQLQWDKYTKQVSILMMNIDKQISNAYLAICSNIDLLDITLQINTFLRRKNSIFYISVLGVRKAETGFRV